MMKEKCEKNKFIYAFENEIEISSRSEQDTVKMLIRVKSSDDDHLGPRDRSVM